MVTLSQLNRHIDDVHSDIEQKDEDFLKSWFKKKVEQAKQFPSVTSVFNSKFPKLDIFDGVDEFTGLELNGSVINNATGNTNGELKHSSSLADLKIETKERRSSFNNQQPRKEVPKIIPTMEHWQKPTGSDKCSSEMCGKKLNSRNGIVNCTFAY